MFSLGRKSALDQILASTRARVAREKTRIPLDVLRTMNLEPRIPIDFAAPLRREGVHIIAEVKLATPSEGDIGKDLDPLDTAVSYEKNGAAAISVLTEPEFFKGHLDYLARIREDVKVPLLMKDFVVDEYQLMQGWVYGADCVLLIVAALTRDELRGLFKAAKALELSVLVEVHTEWEMGEAVSLGATLIGVNNRDLSTLKTDLKISESLARFAAREDVVLVSESGIASREDIERLRGMGYRAFLIGSRFIKTGNPGAALAEILEEKP